MVPEQEGEAKARHGGTEERRRAFQSDQLIQTHYREHSRSQTSKEIEGWKNTLHNDALTVTCAMSHSHCTHPRISAFTSEELFNYDRFEPNLLSV
ncbi:hypothetical protein TNIN_310401 [Trichonephila inaurata madagascariensis]|uniref:Uncharacterized protein n=1 Tax=Trichonephila inaurata madagascariensis TaxID=2747483 RepID=A0A8X7CLM5_9ARAC|nr:hypothetical protein TNIN_310401 [Trichonephila inaurata madagascariensis]